MQAVTAVDVCIIRPRNAAPDPQWLMHAINSTACRSQVQTMQSGTTRKRISRRNLATVLVPVPPLERQRQMVAEIEALLTVIDSVVVEVGNLMLRTTALRGSVLSDAFNGKLVRAVFAPQVMSHVPAKVGA